MLTPQQLADARRYMGYPMVGDTSPDDRSDLAYAQVTSGRYQTLAHRLNTLRAEEEAIVASYLVTLASLENGIARAADNLDTDKAAVWQRNRSEVSDRTRLYNQWRHQLCGLLGIPPGPSLGNSATRVIRN
ncbi:hypothetical protein QNA27_11755 [Pantoea eucalypti]|jgi:hypothetical protein|uniref:hypothetical protein n=1 Tax=Pantoea eucalypti TaxID=470933 RepID=UPI0024BB87CA|nr:hypothetical protein [Pantoea eucalypti]MDJ0474332.1 hypothetical protein [Pantoea eucalypti]